jgi:hypothetical protein
MSETMTREELAAWCDGEADELTAQVTGLEREKAPAFSIAYFKAEAAKFSAIAALLRATPQAKAAAPLVKAVTALEEDKP